MRATQNPARHSALDAAHANVLELGEVENAVLAALAADAAFLHAAEGRPLGGDDPVVQPDDAVREPLGDPPRTGEIPRIDVGREPELRVVGEPYRIFLAV